MATDDERRRVADNMRTFDVVGDACGRYWLNGTLFGMDISAHSEERIRSGMLHLAAFIEPAPKCSEATPKCDRDALLALADRMASFSRDSSCPSCAASGQPECSCGVECRESISHSAARRIREACGEVG